MYTKVKIVICLLIFGGLLALPQQSFANSIISQSSHTTAANDTATTYIQTLGTGHGGTLGSITVWGRNSKTLYGGTPTSKLTLSICESTTSSYTTCTTVSTTEEQTLGDTAVAYVFTFGTKYVLDSSKYYALKFNATGANQNQMFGTTTDSYASGSCLNASLGALNPSTNRCTNLGDLYFEIWDTEPVSIDALVSYVKITSPTNNQTFTNLNNVTLAGTYNYAAGLTVYNYLQQRIVKVNSLTSYDIATQSAVAGTHTFSSTVNLASNAVYSYSACLINGSDSSVDPVCATPVQFTLGTGGGISTIDPNANKNLAYVQCADWGFFAALCRGFVWMFIPDDSVGASYVDTVDSFSAKAPFGYVIEVLNLGSDLSGSNGSSSATLTIPYTTAAVASTYDVPENITGTYPSFVTGYFVYVRTAISIFFWAMLLIYFIMRIRGKIL